MTKLKERPLVKVVFNLEDDWHGFETETVWAEYLSENRCKLKNSPFYAKGVSFEDVVHVNKEKQSDVFVFESISIAAGHSTYRIIVARSTTHSLFEKYWKPIQNLGCSYEATQDLYSILAVDVPSKADIHEVYRLLEIGEDDGIWDFDEGHCGHPL
ncbi:DUF4265 domain-containing protein [Pseudoalteromonas agarivorans]|uniref:DUF4265 domain-containing protein n=1 Tax=Pseudoalteromonas agarivorans TaxID=176102 RepID=UPI0003D59E78|nr:DUF4265 domain-containing protein [Pseudoalteromonas agarivorans]ETJ46816.1 hypothetical protein X564_17505 [Pseudoalteromonas agarivorans]